VWFDDIEVREAVPEVWRRDYENGIALVNAEATPQTVSLGGNFRKIKGTQDPTVNDGSRVTAVTIPPKDGIVLLREVPTPITSPGANDDTYATSRATTLSVTAPGVLRNDFAPTGRTMSAATVTSPANGTLVQNANGSFTYVPNAGFAGVDSFTYRVNDGVDNSAPATARITVTAPVVATPMTPIAATPTIIKKPVVKRVKRSGSRTYSISGSVRLGTPYSVQPASYSTYGSGTTVVLEVQIERYVRKRWRRYQTKRVNNPGSTYTIRTKLRSGKYRARTVVTGGSVATARSAATKSFKVR
jgi:hypothetical protein